MLARTLKWPVISLLLIGGTHFVEEAILPGLKDFFLPPVVSSIVLAVGIWLGYVAVQNGGSFIQAIVAGAILGLLPLMLEIVGFGMILGRGVPAGVLAGVFGFSIGLFGSFIGGGFAMSVAGRGV